jgi:hypothetical protein
MSLITDYHTDLTPDQVRAHKAEARRKALANKPRRPGYSTVIFRRAQ